MDITLDATANKNITLNIRYILSFILIGQSEIEHIFCCMDSEFTSKKKCNNKSLVVYQRYFF